MIARYLAMPLQKVLVAFIRALYTSIQHVFLGYCRKYQVIRHPPSGDHKKFLTTERALQASEEQEALLPALLYFLQTLISNNDLNYTICYPSDLCDIDQRQFPDIRIFQTGY